MPPSDSTVPPAAKRLKESGIPTLGLLAFDVSLSSASLGKPLIVPPGVSLLLSAVSKSTFCPRTVGEATKVTFQVYGSKTALSESENSSTDTVPIFTRLSSAVNAACTVAALAFQAISAVVAWLTPSS